MVVVGGFIINRIVDIDVLRRRSDGNPHSQFREIFLLVAGVGVMLFYRETRVAHPGGHQSASQVQGLISTIQDRNFSRKPGPAPGAHCSQEPVRDIGRQPTPYPRGFRNESAIKVFYGCKALRPLALAIAFFFSGVTKLAAPLLYLRHVSAVSATWDLISGCGKKSPLARSAFAADCRTYSTC